MAWSTGFSAVAFRTCARTGRYLVMPVALALVAAAAVAKDAPLSAVELYTGPGGPSYVLLSEVTINGKAEVRACSVAPAIGKSAYGDLQKIPLAAGQSLEYTADGLQLTRDRGTACVVPSNIKYEKNAPMSPADLAAKGLLAARVLSAAPGAAPEALPPLKAGVRLVFAASPDAELAEFLRADYASTITWWQDFLKKYPDSSRAAQAKQSLSTLLVKDGRSGLAAYQALPASNGPFPDLQKAQSDADQALAALPGDSDATALRADVQAELAKLTDRGSGELDLYKKALAVRAPGYSHLTAAVSIGNSVTTVDSGFAPGASFQSDASAQAAALESSLQTAGAAIDAKKYDDALAAVHDYLSLRDEVARVAAVIDSAYKYHLDRGHELGTAQDWQGSLDEFQKAAAVEPTKEAADAIVAARAALKVAQDKSAAQAAMQQSQASGQQQQYIQAYEVLDNLPSGPHALVAQEMQRLAPVYVQSASAAAKQLQQAHDPIHGLADEVAIVRAYGYLQKAYALNQDPALKDRVDDLADKLSEYYLLQAKSYMAKPLGSGAGVAWTYLQEALPYKGTNLDDVRDAITQEAAAYQMRARLSIRVLFRDQTSRRDSAGFADQLADAIATGLETSGIPVRVIRPGDTVPFEPNFQLIGDVLDHHRTEVPTTVPKDSHYRAGEQDIPNEAWNRANRDYESASLALQTDQAALQGVIAKGKKKEIEEATDRVTADQKVVRDAHARLDAIPKTVASDIIKPYTYTERTIDLSAGVQLQYRVNDSLGNPVEPAHPVSRENAQKFTVLENVKPEDTDGVKPGGTVPDDLQFLTDVENGVRDDLIQAVRQSVGALPQKVYAQAQKQVQDGDMDGAAESYILFLNATPSADTPERQAAQRFLLEQFNLKPAAWAAGSSL